MHSLITSFGATKYLPPLLSWKLPAPLFLSPVPQPAPCDLLLASLAALGSHRNPCGAHRFPQGCGPDKASGGSGSVDFWAQLGFCCCCLLSHPALFSQPDADSLRYSSRTLHQPAIYGQICRNSGLNRCLFIEQGAPGRSQFTCCLPRGLPAQSSIFPSIWQGHPP